MTNDGEQPLDRLAGRPFDEAVDTVLARDEGHAADDVRTALQYITEDGVVSTDAATDAVAHLSKVVSTPETRAELAAIELDDAREAAEPVADVDLVSARLEEFQRRLDAVEDRTAELGVTLSNVVERASDPDDLYRLAADVRDLTVEANETQHAADELQVDVEEFGRWLSNQTVRYDEFAAELDALEESAEALTANANEVAEMLDVDPETRVTLEQDPVAVWLDVSLRHRAVGLLFDDLRTELTALREWPDTESTDRGADLATRLDDLRSRWEEAGARLANSRPEEQRFTDPLDDFEEELASYEPPVDWSEVQARLDETLAAADDLA